MIPTGWRLTWVLSLALLAMSAWVLFVYGSEQEGVRTWIRATARSSALLFLVVFAARPLHRLLRSERTRWTLKNRRYVGVSVAVSHFLHLIAIVWLSVGWPADFEVDAVTLLGGGLGFAFLFAMALTSSNRAVAALGPSWRRLHKTGAWYVWFVFAVTFVPETGWDLLHAAFVAAFLGVALLRLFVHLRVRRPVPAT